MEFRIADTFTDSLAKLTGDEQKAVKTTAFDLQLNPANAAMNFHKLNKSRDKNFWSVRVSQDIRLIVHKTDQSLLLCYVNHHDDAYRWAETRRLETHPRTGAAQLVEVRETVQEVLIPVYVEVEEPAPPKPALFAHLGDDVLLGYGVPEEWLEEVRLATEDSLLDLAAHLPAEAAEALLNLATGSTPQVPEPVPAGEDPFEHPDAKRRFRVMHNVEELERALDYPWEKWAVFLHPSQQQTVERDFTGPARVSGSAGTGKTIVALHRAVFLARANPGARVLLTTFSDTLANALRTKLRRLVGNEPRLAERIDVRALDEVGIALHEARLGRVHLATTPEIARLLAEAAATIPDLRFAQRFLETEWAQVVDAWQLESWEAYRDVARLGRKTRLPEAHRQQLWSMFEQVRAILADQGQTTMAAVFNALAGLYGSGASAPYDFSVVDEAQDLSVSQLRFLAALGSGRPNALFFAGDLGQRIFQQPFSWRALGVDIVGRSRTLRINYRTSHQIRKQADLLLDPTVADVDGNTEERRGTVSVFDGPDPTISVFDDNEAECQAVGQWLRARSDEGIGPHEIGVFVRSPAQIERAIAAVTLAAIPYVVLDEHVETRAGHASVATMHLAKGLEFRAVAVMAVDDEVLPLQERIETVVDESDLKEVYETERHLLYVACTRARDHLLVTSGDSPSEFLDDLRMS